MKRAKQSGRRVMRDPLFLHVRVLASFDGLPPVMPPEAAKALAMRNLVQRYSR